MQQDERLVQRFIERPTEFGAHTDQVDLTANGPQLPVLLKGIRMFCDMRCAALDTEGFDTRYRDIQGLKDCLA